MSVKPRCSPLTLILADTEVGIVIGLIILAGLSETVDHVSILTLLSCNIRAEFRRYCFLYGLCREGSFEDRESVKETDTITEVRVRFANVRNESRR